MMAALPVGRAFFEHFAEDVHCHAILHELYSL